MLDSLPGNHRCVMQEKATDLFPGRFEHICRVSWAAPHVAAEKHDEVLASKLDNVLQRLQLPEASCESHHVRFTWYACLLSASRCMSF